MVLTGMILIAIMIYDISFIVNPSILDHVTHLLHDYDSLVMMISDIFFVFYPSIFKTMVLTGKNGYFVGVRIVQEIVH